MDKHKLIETLGSIAVGQRALVDVDQQLRAIQLLLAYGDGPPRAENEAPGGLKIEVIYAETNQIAIAGAPPGAASRDPASQAFNVCCGRRWGKTVLGMDRLIHPALQDKPVAWFAPN